MHPVRGVRRHLPVEVHSHGQPDAIVEAVGTERPGEDPSDHVLFTIDDDICTRCALCVDRCPTGVIILGKVGAPSTDGDSHTRTNSHGYAYGMRF